MKVIERATTPDGIEILLEDWSEDYGNIGIHYMIGAYPLAKASGQWLIERNKPFRLTLTSRHNENMIEIFEYLKSGGMDLEDYPELYWNGDKDKYYMGIENDEDRENLARRSAEECQLFHLPPKSYYTYGVAPKRAEEIWITASNRAAEEAAELADQGMDYEKALILCNVD